MDYVNIVIQSFRLNESGGTVRSPIISIIIPCYDDAAVLENCLDALINQTVVAAGGLLELVVVLNGCTDRSAEVVQTTAQAAVGRPVRIRVVRLPRPSKSAALNHGDAVASAPYRMYLDADVICDVHLVEALLNVLNTAEPRYATGTIAIAPTRSWVTAAYGRIWHKLVMRDVNGIGLYAVNPRARSRWTSFPAIHSDDKFVRLNFGPAERIRVPAVSMATAGRLDAASAGAAEVD